MATQLALLLFALLLSEEDGRLDDDFCEVLTCEPTKPEKDTLKTHTF